MSVHSPKLAYGLWYVVGESDGYTQILIEVGCRKVVVVAGCCLHINQCILPMYYILFMQECTTYSMAIQGSSLLLMVTILRQACSI